MSQPNSPSQPSPGTPLDSGSQALSEALRGSFAIVRLVMVVLVAVFLFSGFFTVGPQEKAIKLRFGRPVGEGDSALLGSGPHWAWPYPIDEVVKVPITEIQEIKSTVGWYNVTPAQEAAGTEPPPSGSLFPGVDGYVLTADGNIAHTRATLRFRIVDPVRCIFGFEAGTNGGFGLAGISNAVQNALNNALVYSAARFKVDQIITSDRTRFKESVQQRIARQIEDEQLGIVIEQCEVQSVPPRQLKQAFEQVTSATQQRDKKLQDARTEAFKVVSAAGAEAAAITNLAETAKLRLVESVAADADQFRKLLPAYESNRDLFVQQRMVETMGRVLTNVQDKIYLPTTVGGSPAELRLLLSREQPKQTASSQP